MQIAFRVDASLEMGTGHVMRCLTLAESLKARGAICRFICREHPGNLLKPIRERGFEAIGLTVADGTTAHDLHNEDLPIHAAWLGTDWITDANETCAAIGETPVDWLVVDHYALDARWERRLRVVCNKVMVIDDLADRVHDCELLLDQNLGRIPVHYYSLIPPHCTVLVGPRYALLRSEFSLIRDYSLKRRTMPLLRRLLITMGGGDQHNVTSRVLATLKNCLLPDDCRIVVVMGPQAPWLQQVRAQAQNMPWTTEVLVNVSDMASQMANSDLAIGAAGSTSWERCCLGLPTLMVVLADNQIDVANHLEQIGAAYRLKLDKHLNENLQDLLTRILGQNELLSQMSIRASQVSDGLGTERVVLKMLRFPNNGN